MNQWVLILLSVSLKYFVKTVKYNLRHCYYINNLILKHDQVTGAVSLVWNRTRYESFVITIIILPGNAQHS